MAAAVAGPMYTRGGADGPEDRGGSMVRISSHDSHIRQHTMRPTCGDAVYQLGSIICYETSQLGHYTQARGMSIRRLSASAMTCNA
jgi:hypothetical protein